jgi:hypothetical protein
MSGTRTCFAFVVSKKNVQRSHESRPSATVADQFECVACGTNKEYFSDHVFVCSGMSKIKYKMNMTSGSKALGPCAEVLLKEVAPGPGIIRVALYTGFRRLLKFSNLKIAA